MTTACGGEQCSRGGEAGGGSGQYLKATELWSVTESVVEQNTNGVNFYNILTQEPDEEMSSVAGEGFLCKMPFQFRLLNERITNKKQ
ncbi:unnamed protein product, partial [Oncorhynchus mykiss]